MNNIYKTKSLNTRKWVFGQYIFQDSVPYIRSIEDNEYIPIDLEIVCYFFGFHKKTNEIYGKMTFLSLMAKKYVLQHLKELEEFAYVPISRGKVLTGNIAGIVADSKIIGNIFDDFDQLTEGSEENVD